MPATANLLKIHTPGYVLLLRLESGSVIGG